MPLHDSSFSVRFKRIDGKVYWRIPMHLVYSSAPKELFGWLVAPKHIVDAQDESKRVYL